MLMQNTNVSF